MDTPLMDLLSVVTTSTVNTLEGNNISLHRSIYHTKFNESA